MNLTPLEFLRQQGIDLKATSLIVCIDGEMKQPSLTALMDGYHMAKEQEKHTKSQIQTSLKNKEDF